MIIIRKKKSKEVYKIKYDHRIDGGYSKIEPNKKQSMRRIRRDLGRYPYAKASLQTLKKDGIGWKPHSSYMYRRSKKTGRVRLVKL